jgi:hypothetical protein
MAGVSAYCVIVFNVTSKILFDFHSHQWYTVLFTVLSALLFFPMFYIWTRVPVSVAYRDFDIVVTFPMFWFVLIFGTFFALPFEKALLAWESRDKIFNETENDIDA